MSRWEEYGYPDLTLVPIQRALEGLWWAIDERHYARTGEHLTLPPPICPIPTIVRQIDPSRQK